MKKIKSVFMILSCIVLLYSCGTPVQPNYGGVLMENYGKNGKSDYTECYGKVNDWGLGTKLFQVPLWQQRAMVEDTLHMQDARNNEMKCYPKYAYTITKGKLVDVVFSNAQIANENSSDGSKFLLTVENNVLETAIYDIVKEQSRKHVADSLMNNGGSLKFEKECEELIKKVFADKGFTLEALTIQLTYSGKIMQTLDKRLEVTTNVSTLDQEILEQRKKNELEALRTEFTLIQNKVLTPEYLEKLKIEKWDGHLPAYYSGDKLPMINVNSKK